MKKIRLVDDKMILIFHYFEEISINFRDQSYNYKIFMYERPVTIEIVFFRHNYERFIS